jgi:hypothetical protein
MGKQAFNLSGVELAGKNGDKLTYSSSPPYGENDVRHLSRTSSTFQPDWRPATRQSTSTAYTHTHTHFKASPPTCIAAYLSHYCCFPKLTTWLVLQMCLMGPNLLTLVSRSLGFCQMWTRQFIGIMLFSGTGLSHRLYFRHQSLLPTKSVARGAGTKVASICKSYGISLCGLYRVSNPHFHYYKYWILCFGLI